VLLRVLGPLELGVDGNQAALGAAKVRVLLAALAIRRGTLCTTDHLIDVLWGESPPPSAPKLLQVYVSTLRKILPPPMRIRTDASGYALELADEAVDAVAFERLVAEGRLARRAGNPALAASLLRRALALWRGPAYADVQYEPFAAEVIERLEALRALALEERIQADLDLGRHGDVLGEVRGLLAADPTRESLAALAVVAAYRAMGPAAATAILDSVRTALREELGENLSPDLVTLGDRIARRDPSLDASVTMPMAVSGLPAPPNPLIGRTRELAELQALLVRPGVRLVSMTGAGGSGKSRLALELARALQPRFANGAVLVELAPVNDPALVAATIAHGLGLEPGRDATETVREAIAERELLLVLDNVEHLREAAPLFVRLLADAPRLIIVATTRVVLHVSGENVYPVNPMAEDEAVALFVERARARDHGFALDSERLPTITSICRRLDNLPLAIELAAARVAALGLETVDDRLTSRLALLTGGPRDLPARQQTLRETIEWSVKLLRPEEAEVLSAMSVFPGSCSREGAQAVAGATDDVLTALVDHNLVQAVDGHGQRRYRLLETVREYGQARLGARREAVESALTSWTVDFVTSAVPDSTAMAREALDILEAEIDVIREALRHAARDADSSRELAIAAAVWRLWWIRGYLAEGRATCDGILERRGLLPTELGLRVARAAASLAWTMGDLEHALDLARTTLDVATRVGCAVEQASTNNLLATITLEAVGSEAAERHYHEAIRVAESIGRGDLVNIYRMNLGNAHLDAGRLDEARRLFTEALPYEGELANLNLGQVELQAGDLARAEQHFKAAADLLRAIGFKGRVAHAMQGLAAVEARTGRAEAAARRLGQAATMLAEVGWVTGDNQFADAAGAAARDQLGDEAFDRLFREGLNTPPTS
jgi:predicted ATPase/DNA-binding SARP family transcriptional activator/Tfp pilus assembly protein PilF